MPEWLYDAGPNGDWVFLLVTVLMGGLTAYATGSAIASTWRPPWQIVVYGLLTAAAVRFIHFALFAEPFVAPRSYVVDLIVLIVASWIGFRITRRRQMHEQYGRLTAGAGTDVVRRASQ